jgi:hypothetical protein
LFGSIAGNDILLMPEDVGRSIREIETMIENGQIQADDIADRAENSYSKDWAVLQWRNPKVPVKP